MHEDTRKQYKKPTYLRTSNCPTNVNLYICPRGTGITCGQCKSAYNINNITNITIPKLKILGEKAKQLGDDIRNRLEELDD